MKNIQELIYIKYKKNVYAIIIGKNETNALIQCLIYKFKILPNDLTILTRVNCITVEDSYQFINNSFEDKKVSIIEINEIMMKLKILMYDPIKRKDKNFELCLQAHGECANRELMNRCMRIEKQLKVIEHENNMLKRENEEKK